VAQCPGSARLGLASIVVYPGFRLETTALLPPAAFDAVIAAASDPAPEAALFVTVKVAALLWLRHGSAALEIAVVTKRAR